MTGIPITLTGFVADPPEIAATGDTVLEIRFQLVHSPTDDAVNDATVPCVLRDADCSRADAEDFLAPDALIRVTGLLHLPEQPGDVIVVEVTDLEEDGDSEDHRDSANSVVALNDGPQDLTVPVSASSVDGCTVVVCERPDGPPLRYLLTPTGACATVYSEDLVAATAAWLNRSQD